MRSLASPTKGPSPLFTFFAGIGMTWLASACTDQ